MLNQEQQFALEFLNTRFPIDQALKAKLWQGLRPYRVEHAETLHVPTLTITIISAVLQGETFPVWVYEATLSWIANIRAEIAELGGTDHTGYASLYEVSLLTHDLAVAHAFLRIVEIGLDDPAIYAATPVEHIAVMPFSNFEAVKAERPNTVAWYNGTRIRGFRTRLGRPELMLNGYWIGILPEFSVDVYQLPYVVDKSNDPSNL